LKYFHDDEFVCQHCGKIGIEDRFTALLDKIREDAGFPFLISSGYRCAEHPIEKAKSKPGSHSMGLACDVAVTGEQALKVVEIALKHGIKRIGVNQKGRSRFIHLDIADSLPQPTIWSY
tara:strand:- start:2996 stop:3352 length:357 start_codon:yes stop_codon:yes gene_type:complete